MSRGSPLLAGLAENSAVLLLSAFGVGAETDPGLLAHLAEPLRGSLERRARALLDLPGPQRIRFAVDGLRQYLAAEDPASHLRRARANADARSVTSAEDTETEIEAEASAALSTALDRLARATGRPADLVLGLAHLIRLEAGLSGGHDG